MLVVWSDFFAASMPAGPLVPMSAHSISTIAKQTTATMTGTARGFRGSWEFSFARMSNPRLNLTATQRSQP